MKNRVLIGIIIVLVGVIVAEGVYLFTNKEDEKENNSSINIPKEEEEENESNDDETSEDYVKLVDTREEDNQVIQEYEMVLNGEYQEFEIVFENVGNTVVEVNANLANIQVYWALSHFLNKEFNLDTINKEFNENNFLIMKGIDKNYLIVISEIYSENGTDISYEILNSQLEPIGHLIVYYGSQGLILESEISVGYENSYQDLFEIEINNATFIRSKIEDNKIYHYYYNCDYVLEERVYTINNDKLEYEVINTYQVLGSLGAC